MDIVVKNTSKCRTSDLKRLMRLVLKHVAYEVPPGWVNWHLTVTSKRGKGGWPDGWAYYDQPRVFVRLQDREWDADNQSLPRVHVERVVQVMMHELGHCIGLKHASMVPWHSVDVSWLPEDAVLRRTPERKPKSKVLPEELTKKSIARLTLRLQRVEAQRKRLETLLKCATSKLRRQVWRRSR